MIAPQYFKGEVEFGTIAQVPSRSSELNPRDLCLLQAGYAFGLIYMSLSVLAIKFAQITNLGACVQRLSALAEAIHLYDDEEEMRDEGHGALGEEDGHEDKGLLDEENNPISSQPEDKHRADDQNLVTISCDSEALFLQNLQVRTPGVSPQVLVDKLNLQVSPGESLLIMGSSGCGKTSLLRTIAGLWTQGQGNISRPPDSAILFVPQHSYMVIGTLREQLVYPRPVEITDDQLLQVLSSVKLGGLAERVGGLGTDVCWKETLSAGEQQRIGFARVFIQKPKMVSQILL